ncbi:MAG TPA: polysaccharide biosynthesis tyrosine autokinase [Verrucomicrobiae bacterium]|nr:polysaccharide biosynthesis tyrosine autokinase [Verrucomicrobiae bacterium]
MEASNTTTNNKALFQSGPADESKLHFLDYWRIIRIRKTVILAVFLLVVITTTAVTFILPESYMSTARIEVQKDATDISPLLPNQQSSSYDPYFMQTEFEKIRSQWVLLPVIDSLKLDEVWSKRFHTETKLKKMEAFQLLKRQVDVQQARNTSLIEVRAYSEDKQEAADIANEVVKVYQQKRKEQKMGASARGIDALQKQHVSQSDLVTEREKKVDELRKALKISDIGDGVNMLVLEPETVRRIEQDRIRAEQEFAQVQEIYNTFTNKTRSELRDTIPTAYRDSALDVLLENLYKSQQNLTIMRKDYSDEHPEVLRLNALIGTLNQQIDERVGGVLSGLQSIIAARKRIVTELTNQLAEAKRIDAENMEKYRPYFKAKRDLETAQRLRDSIFIRILQETVDASIPKAGLVEEVDRAQPSVKPVRPNIPLNITLGVVVGLVMGFGLAFFIEYLDTSVKTIDDVERSLQAPVLGVIPQNVGSLLEEGPDSPHAEAYRVLRTNLLFGRKDQNANTITVVSGGAGEGKSTTIFNLATIFAQNGAKVLLVDSDLRRPSLHKLLNVSNSMGLTNLLLKQNSIEEVVQTTKVPNLHFMASGKLPSSSLGVLNSTHMKDFVRQARERYDYVFFDSPPIMGVSDASILASVVDMALLVIQYRKYPQVMTLRAKQMVEKVGGNLMGVVLNNINISQDSYYYYYSGYYYDYYSKHDDDAKGGDGKNGEAKKPAGAGERPAVELKQKF